MIKNKYSQIIFNEDDLMDIIMRGQELARMREIIVDKTVSVERAVDLIENLPKLVPPSDESLSLVDWDRINQQHWLMPESYKNLDISQHILDLCEGEAELQRAGEELLLYQERDLFNLLRYLKYLVDIMTENRVIWGVGRGSSVASFVLYKLGVHRINSLHYKLEVSEFLR
jgi:DNA polymerase III alpha subunit